MIRYFLSLLLIFILEKPLFMVYAGEESISVSEMLQVVWHGLPLDLSVSSYLTLLPLLLGIIAAFVRNFPLRQVLTVYNAIVSLVLAFIFIGDAAFYPYSGYKMDSSVLFYLRTPDEALASITPIMAVIGLAAVAAFAILFFLLLNLSSAGLCSFARKGWKSAVVLFILIPFLFVLSRGGLKQSCMNIGHSYFSENQFLNHSAVNPAYNFFDSLADDKDFSSKYDFFEDDEMTRLSDGVFFIDQSVQDSLLNSSRPNVLFIILEGFGMDIAEYATNLDSLKNTGVYFSNCYAGSFRTDRGVVCLLNGFPGLPVTSLMKLPSVNRKMPSIAKSLSEKGYVTSFIYGGDVNFTNMKSYLFAGGYQTVVSDVDFPLSQRMDNPWGVDDEFSFDRLYDSITSCKDSLWHTAYLSLSSHEPFKVPFSKYDEPVTNAFAYSDDCLGKFIRKISASPLWENLLVVIASDHGYCYPQTGHRQAPHVHHIPVLWLGGAVRRPVKVECLMNQSDIAATLMAQMGLDASAFKYSRNVLSGTYSAPSAFYSYIDGFCYMDSTGVSMYDNVSSRGEYSEGDGDSAREDKGKAILQLLYDNIQ